MNFLIAIKTTFKIIFEVLHTLQVVIYAFQKILKGHRVFFDLFGRVSVIPTRFHVPFQKDRKKLCVLSFTNRTNQELLNLEDIRVLIEDLESETHIGSTGEHHFGMTNENVSILMMCHLSRRCVRKITFERFFILINSFDCFFL